jgi:ribosomal-protein-alanine N-acetyltransferase
MSAQLDEVLIQRRMRETDLDSVMAIEHSVYTHPWTRGNFVDSLNAGYYCCVAECLGAVVGYWIVAFGAGEAHLLNLSVASRWQRMGFGSAMLQSAIEIAKEVAAQRIFLEVRISNTAARALYAGSGFREVATRRDYYPAHDGREDARVLELAL